MSADKISWRFPAVAALAALAAASAWPAAAAAQSPWVERPAEPAITLEAIKARPDGGGLTFPSSAWFLSGSVPVAEAATFVVELPLAYGALDGGRFGGGESDFSIGDPYLGAILGAPGSDLTGELGVRVPLASEDNLGSAVGILSDPVDRMEAFLPKVVSFSGTLNYGHTTPEGFAVGLRLGPRVWLRTESDFQDTAELFAVYGLQAGYRGERGRLMVGLDGRAIITESDLSLGERTLHELAVGGALRLGRVEPGLVVRLPLDQDLSELIDYGVELQMTMPLR